MLEVHERTALEQAAALEARDEQLRREAEIVEKLRDVGEALSAVLDVDAVVQLTTRAAVDVTGAQFGAFFYNVEDDAGESYMLYTLAGVPREAFADFPMPRNTPVFGPTFRGDGIVRSDDITADPRYGKVGPHHGMPPGHLPVRSYLAVPVISPTSHEVLGGLFLGHERIGVFDERAERLGAGIAAQTAVALDNANLYRRERQTAVQLQQALLPGEPPHSPHLEVAHRYRPGTAGLHVGGDWYDVIALEHDRLALVIGDVMGRGVRAAATMGQLRTSIRAFAAVELPPAEIAARLNQIIVDLPDEQIATFLYAVYDATARTLTYTSAGHLPPILTSGGSARTLPAQLGPPLGIPGATFTEHVQPVAPGDALVLFTDGLVESRARSAEDGIIAVQQLLDQLDATSEQTCDKLLDTLAGASDEDDVALLYARFP
jgi:serine phosphatase RsbU (regulator of sigma subunit)